MLVNWRMELPGFFMDESMVQRKRCTKEKNTSRVGDPGNIFTKCTLHIRSIAFFSFTRVKYHTLTNQHCLLYGVALKADAPQVSRSSSIPAAFFYSFSSEP